MVFNERKSEQADIPHAQTMLYDAAYNKYQFHALVMGNQTEHHNRLLVRIGYT